MSPDDQVDQDRRRTRIVFPSGREATIWKIAVTLISLWATYMTARIEQRFRAEPVPVCECVIPAPAKPAQ